MLRTRVLLITNDDGLEDAIRRTVAAMGHEVRVTATLEEAERLAAAERGGVLLAQVDSPASGVRRFLEDGLLFRRHQVVLALARKGNIRDAVMAVRAGAMDYVVVHPFQEEPFRAALERAVARSRSRANDGSQANSRPWPFGEFITVDYRMLALCDLAAVASDTDAPLLIEGESGTGKTLLARMVHESSARCAGSFVEVNCGALPDSLLETEFFGHVRGAFASAYRERVGKFEQAHGGSLLLDEIGNASPALQMRLLRVVESGQFERVGDTETLRSNVRILAATKIALQECVAQGVFREDLYHRLNLLRLKLLPLRERVEDIPLLARHFLGLFNRKYRRSLRDFDGDALSLLVHYPWPGNVRELRNTVEHGVIMARGSLVAVEDLPVGVVQYEPDLRAREEEGFRTNPLREALRKPERQCILDVLKHVRWNKLHAARHLRISRSTLYKKIREYGLEHVEASDGMAVSGGVGKS